MRLAQACATFAMVRRRRSPLSLRIPRPAGRFARLSIVPLLLLAGAAHAHSFGTPYNLPVPFWMYAYGASATLAVSFAVVAYFAGLPIDADSRAQVRERAGFRIPRKLLGTLQGLSVAMLALCVATGLVGTRNVYANF